jgi:sigma-B regulation protein RsbQ
VLIGPSPRYVDDGDYVGGFTREQIEGMLLSVAGNLTGWAQAMAPVIAGNADRPELAEELEATFCRYDPASRRTSPR